MVQDRIYVTINHQREVAYELSIGTKIGDLEWHNGHDLALFHQIR